MFFKIVIHKALIHKSESTFDSLTTDKMVDEIVQKGCIYSVNESWVCLGCNLQ